MKSAATTPIAFTPYATEWRLDPSVCFLNHGAFGACPYTILQEQLELRAELEKRPVEFLTSRMQPLLNDSRRILCECIGADPENLVFVQNATAGANSILRSLQFQHGDEILVTDHGYNACRNVVQYVAGRSGATVVEAKIRLPVESPEQVVEAVLSRITERTRLAVLDHISSTTALIFPIEELVRGLERRGVDTLVDGAHAPGMIQLDLKRIGAAYYSGNCHKWLCAPKGAGFLYVRPDKQEVIQPPIISHGYNRSRPGYTRFQDLFDWPGTFDPTPWLCVGKAIRFLGKLVDGSLPGLMRRNNKLVIWARQMLCERLNLTPAGPAAMLGSISAMQLPDDPLNYTATDAEKNDMHRLNAELRERFHIEVPVFYFPAVPHKLLRISAQAYNTPDQYLRLADALAGLL
jgi:isopenicillin-N epimerase